MTQATVAIAGNTFPIKDALKALGGRWNPAAKAWMVPAAKADSARALVFGKATAPVSSRPQVCRSCKAVAGELIRRGFFVRINRAGLCTQCSIDARDEGY